MNQDLMGSIEDAIAVSLCIVLLSDCIVQCSIIQICRQMISSCPCFLIAKLCHDICYTTISICFQMISSCPCFLIAKLCHDIC